MSETVERAATVQFAGTAVEILVPTEQTNGTFSLVRIANPPGCWTPTHRHQYEDETVFVLSGSLRVETQELAVDLAAGQVQMLPRGQAHRLGNAGPTEARMLVLCTPGGFDSFVRAVGRPFSAKGPAMTESDIERLIETAPRYGIELLPPDALHPHTPEPVKTVSEIFDVLGMTIEILAESGAEGDDLCLIRGSTPPGGGVSLHSHADFELLYVLGGTLQMYTSQSGQPSWQAFGTGEVISIPSGVPHALRNRGDVPADTLLITTRRIAGLFRKVGSPASAVSGDAFTPVRLQALAAAAAAQDYWLASPEENAAAGV